MAQKAPDDAGAKAAKATAQQDLSKVPADQRQRVDAELAEGERVLWIGEPEGSTQGRGLLGAMVGSAPRKEPDYNLYAITNRRVMLWFGKGTKVGNAMSFGRLLTGPVTYYPTALLETGIEEDKRIPQGGSLIFKRVKVISEERDNKGKVSRTVEMHHFGLLRIRNVQAVSRLLFETLIRPCKHR
jgi:hypothetical protein